MRKMKNTGIVVMLVIAGFAGLTFQTGTVRATIISGPQFGTWDSSGSPYFVVGDVTVPEGQTLEINATGGPVEVIFNGSYSIFVDGNFYANGTNTNRITFTSNKTTPAPADWGSIQINSIGCCGIKYANITYGNYGIYVVGSSNNSISNSNISSNNKYGIYLSSSSNNTLNNNTASNNNIGIYLYQSGSTTLNNNTASNNSLGISLYQSSNNTINNNAASNNGYGIRLYYSSNNTINNITASNNEHGIYLRNSNSNTVANNNASNNWYSIYILVSSNNTINNNTASNNEYGIYLTSSSSNTINNNTASNNEYGIYLTSSSSNTINNNTMVLDGILIEGGLLGHWNTHSIDISNTVNGKPVYYWKNQTSGTVPANAGQVILANCTNVVIENQNASDGTVGLELGFSSNNTLSNNTASNNRYGIYLSYSPNNTIADNNASNNDYGIYLASSSSDLLNNNTVSSNNWYGIYLDSSSSNTLTNNTMIEDGIFICGLLLKDWNTHSIDTSNTVNGRPIQYWKNQTGGTVPLGAGQVILVNCTNVIVETQYLSNGAVGILLGFSSSNTIKGNTLLNDRYGFYLTSSNSNTIYHNNFINNTNQAYDDSTNFWDNGYPSGGNYWSDYNGTDIYSGPNQDQPGSDGFGDTPHNITSESNKDNYPQMYIYRLPIRINSNADFDAAHRISAGSGTQLDPWIIENEDINGTGYGYCIYIGNTTDYFVVRNCNLYDASGGGSQPYYPNSSLVLYNVTNGILDNNTLSYNNDGIRLSNSSNIIIANNTMVQNGISIWGDFLMHWNTHSIDPSNTVNGKPLYYWKDQDSGTVPANAGQTILANCTNVVVESQDVSSGSIGILLGFSSNNKIANNTASNNRYGIYLSYSTNNTINNNNTANSNYLNGIRLFESSSNNITNNNVSSNEYGIYLESSCNNAIANNNASSNEYGIYIESSSNNNTIANNDANSNGDCGIYLSTCRNNTIANNTCINNHRQGINVELSDGNIIDNNTCKENDESGIHLTDSSNNTIVNNNCSNSISYHGISVYGDCANNILANNTCLNNNRQGIGLWYSYRNVVKNNTCKENDNSGIYIAQSGNNTIENNICSNSVNSDGISVFSSSDYNSIANNTCLNNYFEGINLWSSEKNIVKNNTCKENGNKGIYLWNSNNNSIENNNCSDHINTHGIFIDWGCENNTIVNNTCLNNSVGIYLFWNTMGNNSLNNNTASYNEHGIHLTSSSGNTLINNAMLGNQCGIYLETSSNNNISSCNVSNGDVGLFLYSSDNNKIFDTNVHNNKHGIRIEYSSNNSLEENTIVGNKGVGVPYYSFETNLDVYQNDPDWSNYFSFEDQMANGGGGNPLFTRAINVSGALFFDLLEVHIWGHANSPDLDLAIFLDGKGGNPVDGVTQAGEFVVANADSDADEHIVLLAPQDGTYLIRVFGYNVLGNPGQFDMEVKALKTSSAGISLMNSSYNSIINCTISNNQNGINLTDSSNQMIYYNRFINNGNQSYDDSLGNNTWDNGYPSGGNYWSDYTGVDAYSGPGQNESGSDGIGDSPYSIPGGENMDYYPLYLDPDAPISSVDAISPYWYKTSPLTITATAEAKEGIVTNVSLWYRYSADNGSWGVWTPIGTDTTAPWSWDFDFLNGDGVYEFFSIANDGIGSSESMKSSADALCGYDISPPASIVDELPPYMTTTPFDIVVTYNDSGSGLYCVQLYYRYNSGSWVLYTTPSNPSGNWTVNPITFTNVTDDGIYDFYTIGVDNLENIEDLPIGKDTSTIVDRYAPLSHVNALPLYVSSSDFYVGYSATDNGSGIKNVELFYRFNSGSWESYGNFTSTPIIFMATGGDGLYEFYTKAMDNVNNIETKSATVEASTTLDTTAPIGLSISIDDGAVYSTDLLVDLILSATNAAEMSFSNDGVVWSSWEPFGVSKIGWTLSSGDGTKTVYFQCRDNAGNINVTSDNIVLDTVAPTATTIVIENDVAYTTSITATLSLSASDATSGVYQMRISNDGVFDSETWEAYNSTKLWALSGGDGTKTVYVMFRDYALLESGVVTDTVILDTVNPTGSIIINNGEAYTTAQVVTLTLIANDTNGIMQMRISNDGIFNIEPWEVFLTSKIWTLLGTDGLRTVYIQFMDRAGRISSTYSNNITLDITPPSTTVEPSGTNGNNSWYIGDVAISLNVSDVTSGVSSIYYRIDNDYWVTYTSAFIVSSDGTHTIEFYSIDNAGNTETINSLTINIDKTPPSLIYALIGPIGNDSWYVSPVTITLTPTDTTSGMNETWYRVTKDGAVYVDWTLATGQFIISANGNFTVNWTVRDYARNLKSGNFYLSIDTIPPSTDWSISGSLGNSGWYIGDMTIFLNGTDSTSGLSQTHYRINSGPWQSGVEVNLTTDGIHIVEYYSVDHAGNVEIINSIVVKIDVTAPTIVSTTPANNSVKIAMNTRIFIDFKEPMNTTSVENAISFDTAVTVLRYDWDAFDMALTVTLSSNLTKNTAYAITVSTEAKDIAGNTLASDYTWSFTTWSENDGVSTGDDHIFLLDYWWIILLIVAVALLGILLARRKKMTSMAPLTRDQSVEGVVAIGQTPSPPPPSIETVRETLPAVGFQTVELETETCHSCEFEIEKGSSCPFCVEEKVVEKVPEPPKVEGTGTKVQKKVNLSNERL